jgi:hypothetical protein
MRRLITMLLVASALAGCKGSSGYPRGTEKGRCYPNGTCNAGLTCLSDTCVNASPLTGGTGGSTTFDGAAGSGGAATDAPLRYDAGSAPDELLQDRDSADTVSASGFDVSRSDTGSGGSGSGGSGGSDGSAAVGSGGSAGSSGGMDGGPTGTGGRTGTGGTTANPGTGGTAGKGGSPGSGGTSTNLGTGGSGGSGGTTGTAIFQPRCAELLTAAGVAPTKNGICIDTDPQLCYKTCGPESIGFKSETCTAGVYVEQSGCSFPPGDYSCYRIPVALDPSCPAEVPQATTVCTVAPCTPCNVNGGYLDSSGAAKTGYCVCPAPSSSTGISKWSCAMTSAWPCPAGQGC